MLKYDCTIRKSGNYVFHYFSSMKKYSKHFTFSFIKSIIIWLKYVLSTNLYNMTKEVYTPYFKIQTFLSCCDSHIAILLICPSSQFSSFLLIYCPYYILVFLLEFYLFLVTYNNQHNMYMIMREYNIFYDSILFHFFF